MALYWPNNTWDKQDGNLAGGIPFEPEWLGWVVEFEELESTQDLTLTYGSPDGTSRLTRKLSAQSGGGAIDPPLYLRADVGYSVKEFAVGTDRIKLKAKVLPRQRVVGIDTDESDWPLALDKEIQAMAAMGYDYAGWQAAAGGQIAVLFTLRREK